MQLDFLWLEMSGEDPSIPVQFLGGSFEEFQSFNDLDEATNYFCDVFERPNAEKAHKDERRKNANAYYEQFQGTFVEGSGTISGIGSFATFDLTEEQLKALATVCQSEQGTTEGAAMEASMMANHMDLDTNKAGNYPDTGEGLYDYVKTSGWFANASSYMDSYRTSSGDSLRDDVLEAVRSVLVEGKRTLPGYIDEHDYIGDISSVSNDGSTFNRNSRDQYIKNKTVIRNARGATYTFYCFASDSSDADPFGYKYEENRQKIGEFHYEFESGEAVGGISSAEIPRAAKNINFPYSLIKNGFHEIVVNRYDLQKYNLNTKYKEYTEYRRRSEATLTKVVYQTIDAEGKRSTQTAYKLSNFVPDKLVSETPKNTRTNANGNIDPMLEEQISSSTSITNKYFLKKAFTFDMVYTNDFEYKKYSDEDASARVNADSESVTNRVPYNEKIDEQNKFIAENISGKDPDSIVSLYGATKTQIGYEPPVTTVNETTGVKTIKTVYTYQIVGKEYIENDGEEIYLSRTWSDSLSQTDSESKQVDYSTMVEFNENEENKTNRTTITQKDFEKSKADEYKKYKQMSKDGELNYIDIINSNPKLITTYLSENAKQSEYMGYTKEDDLLVSYSQLRKLVKGTENEDGIVPYAYFISLGHKMGYSNHKSIENEVNSGFGFGWPVKLDGNDGARTINCIYPYTPAYGESHGAIDIAPGSGKNIIIASKDGVIKQVNHSNVGYGNSVVIEHENGFYTRYAHLSSIYADIVVGAEVKKGDELGIMGTTGNSTGVHLHFEILEGGISASNSVDPLDYFVTQPEYGTIDPNSITGLPSGYKFLKEQTGGKTLRTIFVGDSRTIGMQQAVGLTTSRYIAKTGAGITYIDTAISDLKKMLDEDPNVNVVFNYGVNDCGSGDGSVDEYIKKYKALMTAYQNTNFYFLSVNPIDKSKGISNAKTEVIEAFNKKLKDTFGDRYIDSYSYLQKDGFNATDGLHYDNNTYEKIYDFVMKSINEVGTSDTGSTSTGKLEKKTNILIIAGHSINSVDDRDLEDSGYLETIETRKLAIALSNAINKKGMNAVIANKVLAGNKDTYDDGIIWGKYSLYSAAKSNSNVYNQFKGYDHAIEIHFNASDFWTAAGSELVATSQSSITELDRKLLNSVCKFTYNNKKRDPSIQSIATINGLNRVGVHVTYLEVEFYDNKTAMDYVSKNYEAMAQDMAQVLKNHFE